jgi:serine/threonine protein phosphatase PrpC
VPGPSPSSEALRCRACGRPGAPGDRFCEIDGTPLVPAGGGEPAPRGASEPAPHAGSEPVVCACGVDMGVDGGDGYCERCGMLMKPVPAADAGDEADCEVLAPAPDLAAATHRGRVHQVDEDAMAVERCELDGTALHVVVVADGVSASSHGEQCSARAVRAALDTLLSASSGPEPLDAREALRDAVRAAHRAACAPGIDAAPGKAPPGTTLVAAIAHGGHVDVAWVGDSRAYLLGPATPGGGHGAAALLTHDHSWFNEVVESGELTAAQATRSRSAHALTRCLGPLEDPDPDHAPEPSLTRVPAASGSRLVVCTDGLWNSAATPAELGALAHDDPPAADARSLAVTLVRRAFAIGGTDDVTAAVAFL